MKYTKLQVCIGIVLSIGILIYGMIAAHRVYKLRSTAHRAVAGFAQCLDLLLPSEEVEPSQPMPEHTLPKTDSSRFNRNDAL